MLRNTYYAIVINHTCDFIPQALKNAGLVPGADMTFEAGLTKVSYLLGRTDLTLEQKKLVRVFNFTSGLRASYKVVSFLLWWIILSTKLKQRPLSFQNIGLDLLQILNTSDEWHCVPVLYNWSRKMEEARLLVGTISISFMVIISSRAVPSVNSASLFIGHASLVLRPCSRTFVGNSPWSRREPLLDCVRIHMQLYWECMDLSDIQTLC